MNHSPAITRLESLLTRVQERAKAPRIKALTAPEPAELKAPEAPPVIETPIVAAPPVAAEPPRAETPVAATPLVAPVDAYEEAITQFPPRIATPVPPALTPRASLQPPPLPPQSAPPAPVARIAEVIGDEAVTLRPAAPSLSPEAPPEPAPETVITRAPQPLSDVPGTRPSVVAPAMIPAQRPVSLRDLVPEPAPEPEGLPETEVFTLSDSPPPPSKPVAVERFETNLAAQPAAVKVIAPTPAAVPATFRALLLRSLALRPR